MGDVLIKNGLILDGTGQEGFAGHVNVDGEKIASVIPADTPEGEGISQQRALIPSSMPTGWLWLPVLSTVTVISTG